MEPTNSNYSIFAEQYPIRPSEAAKQKHLQEEAMVKELIGQLVTYDGNPYSAFGTEEGRIFAPRQTVDGGFGAMRSILNPTKLIERATRLRSVAKHMQKAENTAWTKLKQHPVERTKEALWEGRKRFETTFEDSLDFASDKVTKKLHYREIYDKVIDKYRSRAHELPDNRAWFALREKRTALETKAELTEELLQLQKSRSVWDKSLDKLDPNKIAVHATDEVALEKILRSGGIKPGTALDTSPGYQWSDEAPIKLVLPTAKRGRHIAHNDYYTASKSAAVPKVIVDMSHYTEEGAQNVKRILDRLKKKYPEVVIDIESSSKVKHKKLDKLVKGL